MTRFWLALLMGFCAPAWAQTVETRDHSVTVVSTVPALVAQNSKLYLRERALPSVLQKGAGDKVVLFVHGAGTPAEAAFDLPYQDYSWMGYLAKAGYDVFAVDMTGYGRSARPTPMDDKCNLSPQQQKNFGVSCAQTYPGALTSMGSDWNDITAAVNYIRKLRRVEKVHLIAWSQGGPRVGGWAAQHPAHVNKMILLAPDYKRDRQAEPPALPAPGPVFNTQSHEEFLASWNRQAPCPSQYDPAVAASAWSEMLTSDPVGASWTPPVRRAPIATTYGWTQAQVKATTAPTLVILGVHDTQRTPEQLPNLYADLGSAQKVFVDLACSSHNAMWEKNHLLLFQASLEWLEKGTVNDQSTGIVRMGY